MARGHVLVTAKTSFNFDIESMQGQDDGEED